MHIGKIKPAFDAIEATSIQPLWEEQQGGLLLAVRPFNKADAGDRDAIETIMRDSIQKVAEVHGAAFSEAGFRNNMQALDAGRLKANIFEAKWKKDGPAIILGAELNWDTVGIDPDGKLRRAFYKEDFCLLTKKFRELIGIKPLEKSFSSESLAECFERISMQHKLFGEGVSLEYGEVDPENTKMMRALQRNGTIVGTAPDSAVLEFKEFPNNLSDKWPMDIKIIIPRINGKLADNIFISRWKEGHEQVDFIVTQGQATAIGKSRVDIRSWRTGNLPKQGVLECVIAAHLLAIQNRVRKDGWGASHDQIAQQVPSPAIPLLGSPQEITAALYGACANDLLIRQYRPGLAFGGAMPDAHVYVMNDRRMLEAFMAVGAEVRLFGDKAMMPGVNDKTADMTQKFVTDGTAPASDNDNIPKRSRQITQQRALKIAA